MTLRTQESATTKLQNAEIHEVKGAEPSVQPWSDAAEAWSLGYIEHNYGIYSKDKHMAALRLLFKERGYNPIIDIVDHITWDGENRCEHFLRTWAKVDDTPYSREGVPPDLRRGHPPSVPPRRKV